MSKEEFRRRQAIVAARKNLSLRLTVLGSAAVAVAGWTWLLWKTGG